VGASDYCARYSTRLTSTTWRPIPPTATGWSRRAPSISSAGRKSRGTSLQAGPSSTETTWRRRDR